MLHYNNIIFTFRWLNRLTWTPQNFLCLYPPFFETNSQLCLLARSFYFSFYLTPVNHIPIIHHQNIHAFHFFSLSIVQSVFPIRILFFLDSSKYFLYFNFQPNIYIFSFKGHSSKLQNIVWVIFHLSCFKLLHRQPDYSSSSFYKNIQDFLCTWNKYTLALFLFE